MFGGGSGNAAAYPVTVGIIPMTFNDSIFASNVPGQVFSNPITQGPSGTISNQDWNETPGYASGDQCWTWLGGNLNMNQCRVDWREGPRLAGASGTFHVDQCYINCVGKGTDHADAFQGFVQTGGTFLLTNSHIRAYTPQEGLDKYGAGTVGSTCFFWADASQGLIQVQNTIIHGGDRMFTVNADAGTTTHINFDHVYFVVEPGYPETWLFSATTGGTLVVDQWNEVRQASIVNGVIVPGTPIASP